MNIYLIIGLSILAFIIFVCFLIGFILFRKTVVQEPGHDYLLDPPDNELTRQVRSRSIVVRDDLLRLDMEEIYRTSTIDGVRLHAYFRESSTQTDKFIICLHGWHGSALSTAPIYSDFLVDYSYNILFIDLRGYGKTESKYATFGTLDSIDLLDWTSYLCDRFGDRISIAYFGISMGGCTVSNTASRVPEQVKCIIDDCGFTSIYSQFGHLLKSKYHLPKFLLVFSSIFTKAIAKYRYRDSNVLGELKEARVPMLFIHGTEDDFVPTYMTNLKDQACSSPHQVVYFPNAPHARSYWLNKEAYRELILRFLAKYL